LLNLDLHCHSNFSDGTLPPDELVARAAGRGVAALALTDHDDTSGLPLAQLAAIRHGITLLNGVEISVTWKDHTIHVVGLGIDPDNEVLQAGLSATRHGRLARSEQMSAAFDEMGVTGTREGIKEFIANQNMVSRTHFARFLVKQRVVKDMNAAFRRFLGNGQPCCVPHRWASLPDAVHWITGSGGIAVIAHPGRYPLDTAEMRSLLSEFRDLGGQGLEVVTSSHKPSQYSTFAGHAQYYGLKASSGSDFHSPGESYHDLGGLPPTPHGVGHVWDVLNG